MTKNEGAGQSAIQVFEYEGKPVGFEQGQQVMVNATQMAQPFGKMPKDFLKTKQTKEFLEALSVRKKILTADLVQVRQGGTPEEQGTWMHEDVAMEFARWLSPMFAIWTNDRIKELLTQGVATVNDDDDTIANAMAILQRRLEAKQQQLQIAESTIEAQGKQLRERDNEIKVLAPMADYTKEVLQSTSTFTLTQVAKDLGMRSVYTLIEFCKAHKIMYKQSDQWMPTAQYSGRGFFQTRTAKYIKSDNTIGTTLSTVVTEKGRVFLHKFYEQKGALA